MEPWEGNWTVYRKEADGDVKLDDDDDVDDWWLFHDAIFGTHAEALREARFLAEQTGLPLRCYGPLPDDTDAFRHVL